MDEVENNAMVKVPYTSENIVKKIEDDIRIGSDVRNTESVQGFLSPKVFAHKKINSLEDYHKYKDLLTTSKTKENVFDKKQEAFLTKYNSNFASFSGLKDAVIDILKGENYAIKDANDIDKIQNIVKSVSGDMSDSEAIKFASEIKSLYGSGVTTKYFEAKIKEVVGLDRFDGIVIPNNLSESTIKLLQDRGIKKIVKYSPEIEGDRKRILNKFFKDSTFMLVPALLGTGMFVVNNNKE